MLILDSSSINRPFDISRQNPALRQRRSQPPAIIMADNNDGCPQPRKPGDNRDRIERNRACTTAPCRA
ncbi:hypothetical protein CBM2633_B10254 [Cupriavidus taiwanensis]|uniref:Uncharacterized protein n=1 Tax=Cupriavidus taiwanensis TaxID=164546 RepID=A0A375CIH0_9BURK|nr:hypothetical protein CBM2586_B130253 [Cupriavidus taiwanensis]SOZ17956.1 hypothetical protein CBM2604_B120258 [Cupriavidus taiwanensis]SOZ30541.1 hypothetical protein CBM2609_B110259 [Cupriavidus taiwanensis]SOZ49813.1 hypothetical protein CBM2610_B90262 [Cupriavidus taiwanensis]SOZ65464.1 hypothetical protein CBM2614_B190052 [Cupriavidus taiwanensis]